MRIFIKWIVFFLFFAIFINGQICNAHSTEKTIVGVVFSADIPAYQQVHERFLSKLKKKGYLREVKFLYQRPRPDSLAWSNAIRKLIAYDATVLITYGSGATEAATYETSDIPVIYSMVYNPEQSGIKGKNLFGVGYSIPVTSLIRYLRNIKPVDTIGIVASIIEPSSVVQTADVVKACKEFSIRNVVLKMKNEDELQLKVKLFNYEALFITDNVLAAESIQGIYRVAMQKKAPLLSTLQGTEEYALITLYPDPEEMAEAMFQVFVRVLKGDRDRENNTVVVKRSRLVYNRRLSDQLSLEPSIELIIGANRIIK